ncbi:NAD(P)H-dependent oxidoreductase [Kineosporia sp. J2-2]|uniref:FMN dependent NADH:quinone oxidoreductase n=1 Tax=Kineosporia corallincola TaxID=2835133 RepID=A0ABS5TPQ2_9ACTN|nr:NAD(P)H-dependent oxidoreductase [Kineosporia corallincola]MBT0773088.1 NAD(P)H-dependent oxidoreductase [Kineosporia corallincola]
MPTLLHLDSSADLNSSVSRALTARFATAWTGISTDHLVVRRDLHLDQLPHLPTDALHWAPRLRRPGDLVPADAEQLQQVLISELLNADVVLIGAPMYNWAVPSTLKAWIDYVHVGGVTSTIDEPTQPLAGKPVVVVSSRGGSYGPGDPVDHQVPSIVQALGTSMGMDVSTVTADLTLAGRLPALSGLTGRAEQERERAAQELDALAERLGRRKG